ncbi:lipopolysaccharide biosynthesis protein RfbH, partial [Burkholderia pseudomallei]
SSCDAFLHLPQATFNSNPSWCGFPLTLREDTGVARGDLLDYLSQGGVGTRLLFAGTLTRQPSMRHRRYRVSGELAVTDA